MTLEGSRTYVRPNGRPRPNPGCDFDTDCTEPVVTLVAGMRYCATHTSVRGTFMTTQLGPAYGGPPVVR